MISDVCPAVHHDTQIRKNPHWLFQPFPEDAQRAVFNLSIISATLLFIAFLISHTIGLTGKLPTCYFLTKTGLYCPACGGTRAAEALMHGNIFESVRMHPIVIYVVGFTILFVIGEIISRITKHRPEVTNARIIHFLGGVFILGVHFLTQNLI